MTGSEPARSARIWRVLALVAGAYLVLFGGFVVFAGQADDSPGLGGLGLLTVAIGAGILYRTLRR